LGEDPWVKEEGHHFLSQEIRVMLNVCGLKFLVDIGTGGFQPNGFQRWTSEEELGLMGEIETKWISFTHILIHNGVTLGD
jgi:hypothetical protein